MPERSLPPHLARLQRDPATGWPAPYVNAWTSENEYECTIGTYMGRPAVCPPWSPGVGNLNFQAQHMTRQRHVMATRTCQVCQADDAPLLVVGPGLSGKLLTIDGRRYVAFTEPWLCRPCADFALEHCPGLIRRRRADALGAITVRNAPLLVSTGSHDLWPQAGNGLVMWVKVAVPVGKLPAGWQDWPAWQPG